MANVESIVSGMAGRYALALHQLAREAGSTRETGQALQKFQKMVDSSPDLKRLTRSPAYSADEQTRAIAAVLKAAGIDGLAARFIQLVAAKRRLFAIGDMIEDYGALDDSSNGVVRAQAVSAVALDDKQTKALRQALAGVSGGKSIEVDVKVDPAILGGLIVKLGSNMLDGSLKTQLNAIRTRMKEVG